MMKELAAVALPDANPAGDRLRRMVQAACLQLEGFGRGGCPSMAIAAEAVAIAGERRVSPVDRGYCTEDEWVRIRRWAGFWQTVCEVSSRARSDRKEVRCGNAREWFCYMSPPLDMIEQVRKDPSLIDVHAANADGADIPLIPALYVDLIIGGEMVVGLVREATVDPSSLPSARMCLSRLIDAWNGVLRTRALCARGGSALAIVAQLVLHAELLAVYTASSCWVDEFHQAALKGMLNDAGRLYASAIRSLKLGEPIAAQLEGKVMQEPGYIALGRVPRLSSWMGQLDTRVRDLLNKGYYRDPPPPLELDPLEP